MTNQTRKSKNKQVARRSFKYKSVRVGYVTTTITLTSKVNKQSINTFKISLLFPLIISVKQNKVSIENNFIRRIDAARR